MHPMLLLLPPEPPTHPWAAALESGLGDYLDLLLSLTGEGPEDLNLPSPTPLGPAEAPPHLLGPVDLPPPTTLEYRFGPGEGPVDLSSAIGL